MGIVETCHCVVSKVRSLSGCPRALPVEKKFDLNKVRPLLTGKSYLAAGSGKPAVSLPALLRHVEATRGLPLPPEVLLLIDSLLAPEDRTNVELALFSAMSAKLQKSAVSAAAGRASIERPTFGRTWHRYLDDLAYDSLPMTDSQCIYRIFSGQFPIDLALHRAWADSNKKELIQQKALASLDVQSRVRRFYTKEGGGLCPMESKQAYLKVQQGYAFIGRNESEGQCRHDFVVNSFVFVQAGTLLCRDTRMALNLPSDMLVFWQDDSYRCRNFEVWMHLEPLFLLTNLSAMANAEPSLDPMSR